MHPRTVKRVLANLLVAAEPPAILLALIVIIGILSLPLFPFSHRVSFPLVPETGAEALAYQRLVDEVRELGLAARVEVSVAGRRGDRLVLHGVRELTGIGPEVGAVLDESGYQVLPFRTRPMVEESDLLRSHPRFVLSIQAVVFMIVGGLLVRFRLRPAAGAPAAGPARSLILGVVGGFAVFGTSLVLGLLLHLIGVEVEEQAWIVELLQDRGQLFRLIPWIVLIVPLSEEIFFRAYVFRFLEQRLGLAAGLVLSSGLFAVVHFNPSGMVTYLGIGFVLALVYKGSSSLVAPVLAHVIYNSLAVLVAVLVSGGSG